MTSAWPRHEYAKKYDRPRTKEAAHFLANCATGLDSKDTKVAGIKAFRELDLFVGKLQEES